MSPDPVKEIGTEPYTWLDLAPRDGGLSSLSSAATRRREGAQQFSHRLHALIDAWTCLWCRTKLAPHDSGHFFYCSDACRQASLEDQKAKRLRYLEKHPDPSLFDV
jgi:hypothetical protein